MVWEGGGITGLPGVAVIAFSFEICFVAPKSKDSAQILLRQREAFNSRKFMRPVSL